MFKKLSIYLLTLLVFLVIDLLWIGFIANHLYQEALGERLASQPLWGVALLFYMLYVVGIFVFAIAPARQAKQASLAFKKGAFLGLLCYATYDLTNLATLKNWPWHLSLIDMGWGTMLSAIVAVIGYLIAQQLTKNDAVREV